MAGRIGGILFPVSVKSFWVSCVLQKTAGGFAALFRIKFNAQCALFPFPVMGNADIFDADVMRRKQGGNGSQGAWAVGNVYGKGVCAFNWPAGSFQERVPVFLRFLEEALQPDAVFFF